MSTVSTKTTNNLDLATLGVADSDLGGDDLEDIDVDDDQDSPDNEVDLGGDDDLGVSKGKGDDEEEDS